MKKFIPKLKPKKAKAKPKLEIKNLSALEAGKAALQLGKKSVPVRRQFEHYTGNGSGDLVKTKVAPSKDWAFRTKAEGRPSLVMPRKVSIKLRKEVWTFAHLIRILRDNEINMGAPGCNWFCHFNTPCRKMTAQDQLDLMMMPYTFFFTVSHNLPKKWIVIEDKGGTEL